MDSSRPVSAPSGSSSSQSNSAQQKRFIRVASAAILAVVLSGSLLVAAPRYRAPEAFGRLGVVGNVTSLLTKQAPNGLTAQALCVALRLISTGTQLNQNAAISHGAASVITSILTSNASDWSQAQALHLLTGLIHGNSDAKDAALKEGALAQVIRRVSGPGFNKHVVRLSAASLAESAADNDAARKKKLGSAGSISALFGYLESGSSIGDKTSINIAWALANLLSDSYPNQGLLLELGGPETLIRLLASGPDQRITQPILYAIANLAAKNSAAQNLLQESGALDALVKMIEEGLAGFKSKASEPFHTEVLEHVAELQRSDPNVRSALAEVGGLEELLGLIEAGSEIRSSGTAREKQLVAVQGEDEEDEIHSIRGLVRDLQDEVDSEAGLMSDVKLPSLSRGPSGAKILHQPKLLSRQGVLSIAAWALSNIVADNTANQDAAREAGAVEALVRLLEGAEDAFVAKGALQAISSLVQGNPTNKAAVREANGVEGLVKLLASNPADKEVLQATAKALKQMAAERPVYETVQRSGSRWLRVLSRQASALIFERLGFQVSPGSISVLIASAFVTSSIGGLLLVVRGLLGSGRPAKSAKKFE